MRLLKAKFAQLTLFTLRERQVLSPKLKSMVYNSTLSQIPQAPPHNTATVSHIFCPLILELIKISVNSGCSEATESSQFANCLKCGNQINGDESASELIALTSSIGCAICQDGYLPQVVAHPVFPDYLYQRQCVKESV